MKRTNRSSTMRLPHGRCSRTTRADRRGAVTLEFILTFPIVFITTLAIFEFGILVLVQQAVVTATIEGSREAAKVGATTDHVAERIQRVLVVHDIEFDTSGTSFGDAHVIIEDTRTAPEDNISGERGDISIDCSPNGPSPMSNQIRVTVCVPVTDADGKNPVPDLLETFGFGLSGKTFEVSSLVTIE